MNYGEELAYWYLRLNGFFPIVNFVLHPSSEVNYPSDVDVLAVRTPYVYEEIGGQMDDWDQYLINNLHFYRAIGVICEVKTGTDNAIRLNDKDYLKYAVHHRLGLVNSNEVDNVVNSLIDSASFENADYPCLIGKLFITNRGNQNGPFYTRTLEQIEIFILKRVKRYARPKYATRMFFPSSLFQLLIAQAKRSNNTEGNAV